MASKRERARAARQATFRDLVEQLWRDRAMSDTDQIEVIDALIVEFTRRGHLAPDAPPPGHPSLPGLEVST